MNLVSVVIPTHNRADLLPRSIESALNQTHTNIEVLVISDGSTDNTKEVVAEISKRDSRVKLFEYFPPRNGNVARNTGISASNGEFIAFLDDDDEWLPEKIEKQLSIIESNENIGMVYTGARVVYSAENIEYMSIPRRIENLKTEILLGNVLVGTSAVLIRKSIFDKCGVFDENLGALQDYDLWIRICQISEAEPISEILVVNYNSLSKKQISALTEKYIEAYRYLDNKYKNLFDTLTEEQKRQKKSLEYYGLANRAMRNGNSKNARCFLTKAMKERLTPILILYYVLSFTSYKTILRVRNLKR